jgi:hypothetical protein
MATNFAKNHTFSTGMPDPDTRRYMVLHIIKHFVQTGSRFVVTASNRADFTKKRTQADVESLKEWVLENAVGKIRCPETGLPLVFLSGGAFGMVCLNILLIQTSYLSTRSTRSARWMGIQLVKNGVPLLMSINGMSCVVGNQKQDEE